MLTSFKYICIHIHYKYAYISIIMQICNFIIIRVCISLDITISLISKCAHTNEYIYSELYIWT